MEKTNKAIIMVTSKLGLRNNKIFSCNHPWTIQLDDTARKEEGCRLTLTKCGIIQHCGTRMNERNISKIIIWPTKNVAKVRGLRERSAYFHEEVPSDLREGTAEWHGYAVDWTVWQVSLFSPKFWCQGKEICWGVGRLEHTCKGQQKYFGILLLNTNNVKIFQ